MSKLPMTGGNFSTVQYSQSGGPLTAANFYVGNAFSPTGGVLNAYSISLNATDTIA